MSDNTYWNNKGKHQALYNKVSLLIPAQGEVPDGRGSNRALEKLRKAANCYYDLFNNGLCNRAAEFRRVFGFSGTWIVRAHYPYSEQLETAMDKIVLEAVEEQGVHLEGYEDAIREIEEYDSCVNREKGSTLYFIQNGIKITTILPVAY